MTNQTQRHLRAVTAEEADLARKRAQAWARFLHRYPAGESRRTMQGALDRVAFTFSAGLYSGSTFPWEMLCDDDLTQEVWDATAKKYARATATRDASALRMMLTACWKEGLLSHEQLKRASAFRTAGLEWTPSPGRTLSDPEVAALIGYDAPAAPERLRARDRALILLMASTGARRNEIAHIATDHLDIAESRVRLETTKSGVPRDAWLHESAIAGINQWLLMRAGGPGPVFTALSRTGRPLLDRPLSAHQMWKILRRRAENCGIGHVTPHDLRRFVVTRLLEGGHDLLLVSRLVGHSDPAVTKLYDRRPAEACRAAVRTLPLPMPRPGGAPGVSGGS